MTPSRPTEMSAQPLVAVGFVGLGFLMFLCSCLLVWFAHLREDQLFWRNAGGYPVMLRDFVLLGYYPLFLVTAAGTFALSMTLLARIGMPLSLFCLKAFLILCCWVLIFISLLLSFGDNVHNFWTGKPLHDESPY